MPAPPPFPPAPAEGEEYGEEELDFNEDEAPVGAAAEAAAAKGDTYAGAASIGWREFAIKEELLKAIQEAGWEHPSEVQQQCIPKAVAGSDIVCQAKAGRGKTGVFVISLLQQLDVVEASTEPGGDDKVSDQCKAVVMCHTRELALQIQGEFDRLRVHLPHVRLDVFVGGIDESKDRQRIKKAVPHVAVGTPGRLKALVLSGALDVSGLRFFVLDECDKMLEKADMRGDVQKVFLKTPQQKQVLMFTATLPTEIRAVCKKFMRRDPLEVLVDDEKELTLHGLVQHYVSLPEEEKNKKLFDVLDTLDFKQVVVFVKTPKRAEALAKLMRDVNFPALCIHGGMKQAERSRAFQAFRSGAERILVSTDLAGRGVDVVGVNVVINYDMPVDDDRNGKGDDTYLHRVGRAGRFGTKGLAITFVASEEDTRVLQKVQERFTVEIKPLPDTVDKALYFHSDNLYDQTNRAEDF